MKLKKFLPGKRTVIVCLLIAALLVSTSIGLGYSKFTGVSAPDTFEFRIKNYDYPSNRFVVLEKDSATTGTYQFRSPDGNAVLTYSKDSTAPNYLKAEYLVGHFNPQVNKYDYTAHIRQIEYQYEIGLYYISFDTALSSDRLFDALNYDKTGGITGNSGIGVVIKLPDGIDVSTLSGSVDYVTPAASNGTLLPADAPRQVVYRNMKWINAVDSSTGEDTIVDSKYILNFDKKTWIDYADTGWYESDPDDLEYWISNASELAGLAKLVNNGMSFAGKTIYLTDDIDLSDADGYLRRWIPIGTTSDNPFCGSFDGQNHKIYGLNVPSFSYTYTSSTDVGAGLFGYVSGSGSSVLKDLEIDTAYLAAHLVDSSETTMGAIGTLAGFVSGCDITGVTVTGSRVCGAAIYGGCIVGYCKDDTASFTGCSISGCSFNNGIFTRTGGTYGYRKTDGSSAPAPTEAPAQAPEQASEQAPISVATPDQPE